MLTISQRGVPVSDSHTNPGPLSKETGHQGSHIIVLVIWIRASFPARSEDIGAGRGSERRASVRCRIPPSPKPICWAPKRVTAFPCDHPRRRPGASFFYVPMQKK